MATSGNENIMGVDGGEKPTAGVYEGIRDIKDDGRATFSFEAAKGYEVSSINVNGKEIGEDTGEANGQLSNNKKMNITRMSKETSP